MAARVRQPQRLAMVSLPSCRCGPVDRIDGSRTQRKRGSEAAERPHGPIGCDEGSMDDLIGGDFTSAVEHYRGRYVARRRRAGQV